MERSVSTQSSHEAFDELCGELDDYDAMPTPQQDATRRAAVPEPEEQLDDQILAAFVTP
jgi:hypothetical protein